VSWQKELPPIAIAHHNGDQFMMADLRLTWRGLRRQPAFVAIAVCTLALGIGVNTAVFSLVKTFVWMQLPVRQIERVIYVTTELRDEFEPLSEADYLDVRARVTTCAEWLAAESDAFLISAPGGTPERFFGERLSAEGVQWLGVKAHLGRWFGPDDDKPAAPPTVVLSHRHWREQHQGDSGILGRQLKINGEWATVIGVAEEGFQLTVGGDAWMPLRLPAVSAKPRRERNLRVLGRLKPGVSRAQARAELAAIGRQLAAEHPDTHRDLRLGARQMQDMFIAGVPSNFQRMSVAAFCVLLIACVNVANLLLARGAGRQRELAVRLALGATRGSLVRLWLRETLVLAGAGAGLGLGLAAGLLKLLRWQFQSGRWQMPYWMHFDLDGKSLVFVVAAAGASCLLAGLVPAWRLSRPDLNAALRDSARGATGFALGRFMQVLVVIEVALSCALLVLAGMNIRSMFNIASARLGYEPAGVFCGSVYLSGPAFAGVDRQVGGARELLAQLVVRPEVAAAAIVTTEPTWQDWADIVAENQVAGAPRQRVARTEIMGDYFSVLGIRRLRGRAFDEHDTRTAERVAIINPILAERIWPGQDPVGRRFRFDREGEAKPQPWITVVGVVAATLQGRFNEATTAQVYTPLAQHDDAAYFAVLTRTRPGDPAQLAPVVRQVVRSLNPDLAVINPDTLTGRVERAKAGRRLWVPTYLLFGAVALALAAVGLYGVMSYGVARRIPEIGVRVALGATPRQISWLIARQAGGQLLGGLLAGTVIAYFFARHFGTYFF